MENVEAGAIAVGIDREAARRRALDIIDGLGLGDVADRPAGTLPFGSERRVGIGRAIAMRPTFLLMDEPAAGLNDTECADLEQVIRGVRQEIGCGILLIEHRMSLVFSLCDRIHVLEQGRTHRRRHCRPRFAPIRGCARPISATTWRERDGDELFDGRSLASSSVDKLG